MTPQTVRYNATNPHTGERSVCYLEIKDGKAYFVFALPTYPTYVLQSEVTDAKIAE